MKLLNVSGSPHVHGDLSVKRIMWDVNIALIPIFVVSLIFFGLDALFVSLVSVFCCVLFQWIIEKFLLKKPTNISDGSAVITGLLLAFNLPSNLPLWMVAIGAFVAIAIGKMTFGGLGQNPFNPALVGRVFLLISFPVQMTTWPKAKAVFASLVDATAGATDATTGATPLAMIKEAVKAGDISSLHLPDYWTMLIGQHGGSLGEVSAIAIIIGGVYLLCRKVISWHIPVSFILSAFIFSGILHWIAPASYIAPMYHILTGGLLLGAVFMATDMVTSPMSKSGQIVFGVGCGLLTIIIRTWGAYPEGVSFAILLMNSVTPLINKGFKPKHFAK